MSTTACSDEPAATTAGGDAKSKSDAALQVADGVDSAADGAADGVAQPDAKTDAPLPADAAAEIASDTGAPGDAKTEPGADAAADASSDADSDSLSDAPAMADAAADILPDSPSCAEAVIASAAVQDRQLKLMAKPQTANGKPVTSFAWSIQVPKAGGKLSPDASSPQVTFGPLVYRGSYEACLQVTASGEKPCAATCQTLTFEPDLYLELTWLSPGAPDPVGSESADLNLHLVHGSAANGKDLDCDGAPDPWYDDKAAAYWFNPDPDWGQPGSSADNPSVDDAANALKPEVISLELPQDGTYTVAVHALSDKGVGASLASLSVYYKGKILSQQAGISLAQSDLWIAGAIAVQAGTASFSSCLQSGDACKGAKLWQPSGTACITPCFEYKGLFSVPTPMCTWKWQ